MYAKMCFTKKAFLDEVQAAIPTSREMKVNDDGFCFTIDIYVLSTAWNRALQKAEAIRDKWVEEDYDVRMSTFIPFRNITFHFFYD